jgi:hypothetical protein
MLRTCGIDLLDGRSFYLLCGRRREYDRYWSGIRSGGIRGQGWRGLGVQRFELLVPRVLLGGRRCGGRQGEYLVLVMLLDRSRRNRRSLLPRGRLGGLIIVRVQPKVRLCSRVYV